MLLNDKQVQAMADMCKAAGVASLILCDNKSQVTPNKRGGSAWGSYAPSQRTIRIYERYEDSRGYYNNELFTFLHSPIKTFFHELTHHLQCKDGKYPLYGSIPKGIYSYNEIVANTTAMLFYRDDKNAVMDNASYVNSYLPTASKKLLHDDLKADIDKYYKVIQSLIEKCGLEL